MLNPMSLEGRSILVTGASSGIGRETAMVLSQLGAHLILVARSEERLEQTAAMLEGDGHRIAAYDLNNLDDLPSWLKKQVLETGPLYGLVHSAGIQLTRSLRYVTNGDVDEVMHVNVNAAITLAKGFRQKGVSSPHSSIVFLASVAGLVGQPGTSAYAASKGAIIALTKSLALELAPEDIRVNCIVPGLVQTEMLENLQRSLTPEQFAQLEAMYPLGIGTARDVAYAITFLLADTARWITGTALVVDGGFTAH